MWGHFEMLNFASPIKKVDKKLYIVYKNLLSLHYKTI